MIVRQRGSEFLKLSVEAGLTIDDVKATIQNIINFPKAQQRLVRFHGPRQLPTFLENGCWTLSDYNIQDEVILHLMNPVP